MGPIEIDVEPEEWIPPHQHTPETRTPPPPQAPQPPEEQQAPGSLPGGRRHIHPGSADSHEQEQYAPNNRKYGSRRRHQRLYGLLVIELCAASGQQPGQRPHQLRQRNPKSIYLPLCFFHTLSPSHRICIPQAGLFPQVQVNFACKKSPPCFPFPAGV